MGDAKKILKKFFGAVHFPLFSVQGVAYKWGGFTGDNQGP